MNDLERKLWRAVVAECGGAEVAAMLNAHARGKSLESLARENGVTKQAIAGRMNRMRRKLATHGLLPAEWLPKSST